MDRSIVNCGPGTIALCAIVVGRASVTPVPYSEMASSAYMAPEASDACLTATPTQWTGAHTTRPSALAMTVWIELRGNPRRSARVPVH